MEHHLLVGPGATILQPAVKFTPLIGARIGHPAKPPVSFDDDVL
jgi:hypothetical protein